MHKQIKEQILESISVKELTLDSCLNDIGFAAEIMIASIRGGGKILWCGNGGSASDSQHLSAELLGRLKKNRRPLRSISLSSNISFIHFLKIKCFWFLHFMGMIFSIINF